MIYKVLRDVDPAFYQQVKHVSTIAVLNVRRRYARQQRSAGRTEESHRRVSGVIPDTGPNQVNRHLPTGQNQHMPRGRNRQYFPGNRNILWCTSAYIFKFPRHIIVCDNQLKLIGNRQDTLLYAGGRENTTMLCTSFTIPKVLF